MTVRLALAWLAVMACLVAGCGTEACEAKQTLAAGRHARMEGSLREALDHFRRAVEQAPTSHEAQTQRGEVAETLGEFDEALEAYEAAARLAPSAARIHRVGVLAERMGNTDVALEWLRASLAGLPASWSDPRIQRMASFLLRLDVRRERVAEDLFQALVESGDRGGATDLARSEGWLREGTDYCRDRSMRISREARALLAMLIHPETADCLLPLGRALAESGHVRLARLVLKDRVQNSQDQEVREEAETLLQRRLPAHDVPMLAESLAMAGDTLQNTYQQPLEALEAYQKAIAADPGFVWPYSNTGNVLVKLGEDGRAIEWFRKAVAMDPNQWMAQFNLGWAAFRLHRYEEARAALGRAVALAPGDANAHFGLGLALLNLGLEAEGTRELQVAVRLDPTLLDGRTSLSRGPEKKPPRDSKPSGAR
jgi:tetratricopeptide (TPR) repeat protein